MTERLYWKLPYALRCAVASQWARRTYRLRYGAAYEAACRDIEARRDWSRDQHLDDQLAQLRRLIAHAAEHVPHYRKAFRDWGVTADSLRNLEDLARLPILDKDVVRADPGAIVDERLDRRKLIHLHTSGTTGKALDLYRDIRTNSAAFAYMDERCWEVAGVRRRRDRSAAVGVYRVCDPQAKRPPFWVHNSYWNQVYFSAYHLAPQHLGAYVEMLRRFAPAFIAGYPSAMYAIAQHILENGLEPLRIPRAFSTAETLFDFMRTAISEAFHTRVHNQYGAGEMIGFAVECEAGSMHLSPGYGVIEVVDDEGLPLPAGQTGHIVATSLLNPVQPFIRYRIGDMGSLRPGYCECGAATPLLGHIEGRIDDVLVLRDGRRIGRLDPVFKDTRGVTEAQIAQVGPETFHLRLVPGSEWSPSVGERARSNLRQIIGAEQTIVVQLVDRIPRTPGGKFKVIVNQTPRGPGSADEGAH